jgi:chromosomal replication initiation ATPase DnaA
MSENKEMINPYVFPGLKLHLVDKVKYGHMFKPEDSPLTKDQILEIVSKNTGITISDIVSDIREGDMVVARYISMAMLRMKLDASLVNIGKYLGRDHTTIIYGLNSFETRYKLEDKFKSMSDKVAACVGINIDEKLEKEKLKKNGKRKYNRKQW